MEGGFVLGAAFYTKLLSFITSLLLIRVLNQEEYGVLSYSLSVMAFFIPFSGGGVQHSYLKFASTEQFRGIKNELFVSSYKRGLLVNFILGCVLLTLIPWIDKGIGDSSTLLFWLIFYPFSYFTLEMIKVRYRVQLQNKKFALLDVYNFTFIMILGIVAAYFYGAKAYVIVYVAVPLLVGVFKLGRLNLKSITIPTKYYTYGLWVGLGAIASQLMYSLDVFLVGHLVQDPESVAIYRSATIIPIALFFIPNSYITTHYAALAENEVNKPFLLNFVKGYLTLFSTISLVIGGLLIYLSDFIVELFFGSEYTEASYLFQIIVVGMVGAFILRIPFGNMLAAVGKSNWNALVAFVILALNGILNYWAINEWGIMGAAYVTSGLLWLSGLISAVLFRFYLRKLK